MAITTNGKVSITNLQVGSSADLAGIISDESGTGVLAFTTSPTFTTPALGTPSALVLTNATGTPSAITLTNGTGLPVSGITASTSSAIGVGSVELGHATDTTIARASAGVVTIEGVNVVTTSSTDTLTNKTLTSPVISSITNTGTLTLPTTTGTLALTTDIPSGVVTETGTQTLTNKTLTSPIISTISNTGTITLPTSTGTLALTSGVINNTLLSATGDSIYASSANTPARLAIGTTGQILTVAGGIPTWATPAAGTTANDQAFAFAVQVFA
jgi:hypothetical protein